VLVKRDDQQFEVATFRRDVNPADFPEGVPPGDNVFGTPEEDARRRDFTINGLFYDPINEQLIDYVNGLPDIQARTLRMIGDPDKRLVEDPIRILRGLRLAHKLGFVIEPELRTAMAKNASSLLQSVLPRRREEILKILRLDDPAIALMECYDLGILQHVVPTLHDLLSNAERRDLFLQHFETYRTMVNDPSDTTQLFGWLVFSMFKAALEGPTERETPITLEDDIFQRLMRDELGMYKFEQSALVKAIEILPAIAKVEDFRRRGERRQLAMIRNEGFQLALRFCEADLLLNGSELEFWRQALTKLSVELERIAAEVKAKKRRPRRRRRTESERLLDGTGNRPTGTSAAPEEKHGGDTSGPDDAEELG
jgi:poly(A) polymerase